MKKYIFPVLMICLAVVFSAIFVYADGIELNDKFYDKLDKRLVIEDSSKDVLIDIKLTSPQKVLTGRGLDVKVAEFYLEDYGKISSLFDSIDFYDVDSSFLKKSKDYWFKYGEDYIVEECHNLSEFEPDIKEDGVFCQNVTKTNWTKFNDLKEIPTKKIKIGLFTNTMNDHKVEWIPTIKEFRIEEWAEYEIVGLATYTKSSGDYSIDGIRAIAISQDGNYLITSSASDSEVSIMNITDKTQILPLATYHDFSGDYAVRDVYSLAISQDGNYLITSSYAFDRVSIMNITDKTQILPLANYTNIEGDYSSEQIWSLAISQDGNYLITSSDIDDCVSIMNITDKTQILPLATYHDDVGAYSLDYVRAIAISQDGNYLATSSYLDNCVSIMNITDKTQILPLATYCDSSGDYSVEQILSLAISQDGNYLITSSSIDDYVSIMNITDKTQILPLATYYDSSGDYSVEQIFSLAISQDGNYLITSSNIDDYVSIMNFSITEPSDTCTCPSVNTNWEIDLSDYCIISSACNIGTGNITFTGVGNITFSNTITACEIGGLPANQIGYLDSDAIINLGGSC